MPPYEDVIRVFNTDASKEFTDVWTFPSVRPYKGKHPAEKPAALLEHVVGATTRAGDIVLDCFGGSGSTAIAAIRLGRRTVSIEIDPAWAAKIATHVEEFYAMKAILGPDSGNDEPLLRRVKYESAQMALFPVAK